MDRLQQRLALAVGALALLAVGGLIALWPQPIEVTPPGEELTAVAGRVVAIETYLEDQPDGFAFSPEAARIDLELLDGPEAGEVVRVDTPLEGYPEFDVGDRVRLVGLDIAGTTEYSIVDFERGRPLLVLALLFVVVVLSVGGMHGLRSLVGLGLSLAVVVGFVVPAILSGSSPFAVAFFGALTVMLLTLPLAHGINPMTGAAVVGTGAALVLTVVLGLVFIDAVHLTGFSSEEANLARFAVPGLDPKGLVLAGLIIAALGVLDDVTVSQASTVFALRSANPSLGARSLFRRAMDVGRDHIASTVNTLVLAYVGASLALLVLFSTSGVPAGELIGSEVIAEEVVKTLVGSIGLIAAVPLTTALAAALAVRADPAAVAVAASHGHSHGPVAGVAAPEGHGADDGHGVGDGVGDGDEDDEERDFTATIEYLKYGDAGPPGGEGGEGGAHGPDDGKT